MVTSTITVSELNEYPVKSCAPQQLEIGTVTSRGFQHDRIAQVTDQQGRFCTPRDRDKAKLFQISARVCSNNDGKQTLLQLKSDDNDEIQIDLNDNNTTTTTSVQIISEEQVPLIDYGNDVAAWLEQKTGIPNCRLTGIGPDFHRHPMINPDQGDAVPNTQASSSHHDMSLADEAPFLLTSEASLDDLNRRLVARDQNVVDMRRFRPNIVVKGLAPWEEDTFRKIRINGNVDFFVWQRCGRCTMTTIDRDSLQRGPEPLATLSTFRERAHGQRNFGMHMIPIVNNNNDGSSKHHTIKVGDVVEVLEYDEERRAEWKRLFDT